MTARPLIIVALLLASSSVQASPPSTSSPPAVRVPLLGDRDVAYAAGAALAVGTATMIDSWIFEEAPEAKNPFARGFSRDLSYLGNPLTLAPVFAGAYAAGRVFDRPALSHAAVRVFASALVSGVATDAIKLATGRSRPSQAPGDSDVFRPFSGNSAFPSGHTTFAFSIASAIDHETRARWVPWVVYPAASLVGWSRLRDDKHWMSDVVAGAAMGYWVGEKVDGFLRARDTGAGNLGERNAGASQKAGIAPALGERPLPFGGGASLALTLRF